MADRDVVTGKFIAGNRASPGRKPRKVEDAIQDAMIRVASDYAETIAKKLLALFLGGDVSAGRLLLEYTARKPLPELSAGEVALLSRINALIIERGVTLDKLLQDVLEQLTTGPTAEDTHDERSDAD